MEVNLMQAMQQESASEASTFKNLCKNIFSFVQQQLNTQLAATDPLRELRY